MITNFEVEQAAYHRNGVSGEGFYVGIAKCWVDDGDRRMLVTFFPDLFDGEPLPAGRDASGKFANPRIAVMDLDDLEQHWRGDNFTDVADAIVKEARA